MTEAWIIDACRTPRGIGKVGKGALADIHPQQLGATVLKALKERNNLNTADVGDVIWGCSSQRGPQGGDMGRMSALDAGYDVRSSGVTLDRFCGSGITVVNLAAATIMAGMEDLVVAGGCEMMSMAGRRTSDDGPPMMDGGNLRLRASQAKAFALTPSPPWKASAAKPWTIWPSKASAAPPSPSPKAASIRAWCPSIMKMAPWRSTAKSSPVPRPPAKVWPR
jgi:acetyl-CoA acetyltransferase